MGMTMTQKILAAHAGLDSVVPGQLIEAKLDVVMANDITGPMAVPVFNQMADKVFDKDNNEINLKDYSDENDSPLESLGSSDFDESLMGGVLVNDDADGVQNVEGEELDVIIDDSDADNEDESDIEE